MVEDFHFFTKICNSTFTHIRIYRLRDRGGSLFKQFGSLSYCTIQKTRRRGDINNDVF